MTYQEVLENARKLLYPKCKVCPVCNGRACAGQVPGVGGIGSGRAFTVCREYLDSISIPLDPVHEHWEADPSIELFGRKFSYPFFIAPNRLFMLPITRSVLLRSMAESVTSGLKNGVRFFS